MDFMDAMQISSAGMRAQGDRLRVTAENIANADTAANTPNSDPYRRKTVIFKNELDRANDIHTVKVDRVVEDQGDFKLKYMPSHPGADANGYVRMPNIDTLVEMMDMREAQRSYEANLGMVQISKAMFGKTIDLIGQ